ncbi:MAG: hypothetical protein WCK46_02260 [Candidatus Adlerbacteria bacterium]
MKVRTLRKPETEAAYQAMKDSGVMQEVCRLCEEDVTMTFTHWKLVPNRFPYDKVFEPCDMLIPIRHTAELNEEEKTEFEEIKKSYINSHYRYIMEATHSTKSIPQHYHVHVVEIKEEEK